MASDACLFLFSSENEVGSLIAWLGGDGATLLSAFCWVCSIFESIPLFPLLLFAPFGFLWDWGRLGPDHVPSILLLWWLFGIIALGSIMRWLLWLQVSHYWRLGLVLNQNCLFWLWIPWRETGFLIGCIENWCFCLPKEEDGVADPGYGRGCLSFNEIAVLR